ncbi:MAG: Stk1 family PASTA domain-containing Ser/Thr kinase [Ruminococcaceae bacterium]|nr:Stk1 family PASTA domain-containing Ser/Thr kinase [Oscillospiraceae bacterium]
MNTMINTVLGGRYTILETVGVGGMSVVYKAVDSVENRFVAIKVLKPEFLSDERFRRRFLNESRAIAMLSHVNIVDVYDVNFEGDNQYIVMEYIEGRTLKEYMEFTGAIPIGEVFGYIKQTLRALRHAHERGIVHRDIKPQNIMLLDDGTIKVMDFGIAHVSNFETITMTDTAIGSVHYISPEQAKGLPVDDKSDIYSTGVMLYEMMTGVLPFTGETPVTVALKQVQTEPKKPSEVNPNVSKGMEQIILKAMKKDPAERYQHAKEMLVDIKILEDNKDWVFDYPDAPVVEKKPENPVEEEKKPEPEIKKEPETVVPKKKKKKVTAKQRKWRVIRNKLLAVTAGVFLAVVLVMFGLGVMFTVVNQLNDDLIELPNLVGQVASDVMADPRYNSFFEFSDESRYDDTIGAGLIVEQSPEEGNYSRGTKVKLVVSNGKRTVTVPDVNGWEEAQAIVKLKQSDLLYEIIQTQSDSVEDGKVIRTEPSKSTTVPVGTTVKLYVSFTTEATRVYVPGLVGYKEEIARQTLQKSQLYYFSVRYEYDDFVEKGYVISQSIEKETIVDVSEEIIIVVSLGSVADAIANGTYMPQNDQSTAFDDYYDTGE